jgi:hypothetical protein
MKGRPAQGGRAIVGATVRGVARLKRPAPAQLGSNGGSAEALFHDTRHDLNRAVCLAGLDGWGAMWHGAAIFILVSIGSATLPSLAEDMAVYTEYVPGFPPNCEQIVGQPADDLLVACGVHKS